MKTNTGNETKTPPIYSVRDFMGLAHTVPQGEIIIIRNVNSLLEFLVIFFSVFIMYSEKGRLKYASANHPITLF